MTSARRHPSSIVRTPLEARARHFLSRRRFRIQPSSNALIVSAFFAFAIAPSPVPRRARVPVREPPDRPDARDSRRRINAIRIRRRARGAARSRSRRRETPRGPAERDASRRARGTPARATRATRGGDGGRDADARDARDAGDARRDDDDDARARDATRRARRDDAARDDGDDDARDAGDAG